MPEHHLKAVIWDMDGVIVDSGPYHYQAWREVFRKRGVAFTREDFRHNFGQRNDDIIRNNIGRKISQEEVDTITREKEESFRRRAAGHISTFPGVFILLQELESKGIKSAIASSAPPENIDLVLRSLGIKDCFQAIVWGREVSEGKPSPQGFLLAAQKLGVSPQDCVVLEDAVTGVTAAKRAGMQCVAVTNTHPPEKLGGADLVVASLKAVSVPILEKLFYSE